MMVARLPWRALSAIGVIAGSTFATLDCRKRGRIDENLSALGLTAGHAIRRELWGQVARSYLEILWFAGRRPAATPPPVRVEGLDALHAAARAGRGVLVASAHLGSWELASVTAAGRGIPVAVVARPMRIPSLERRLVAWRQRAGVRTFMRDQPGASVAAYRWLVRGGILGCMIDRAGGGRRLLVPFLGRGTHVPLGPAMLAHRAGSALAVGLTCREPDGAVAVRFRQVPSHRGDSPQTLARAMAEAVEHEIRRTPEQWLWMYRSQPEFDHDETEGTERIPA